MRARPGYTVAALLLAGASAVAGAAEWGDRTGTEPGTVMFCTKHKNGRESGSLRAPFEGVHGWYLNNESGQDIVVHLEVAGYFIEE